MSAPPAPKNQDEYDKERKFASALFLSAHGGNVIKLKQLAKQLEQSGEQFALLDYKDGEGRTPLFFAVEGCQFAAVDFLLKQQKNEVKRKEAVNVQDARGNTPLMVAATRGNSEAVKTLLKLGANTTLSRPDGTSAIHLAAMSGSIDVIALIAGASSDIKSAVNSTSHVGTPLHWSSGSAHAGATKKLLELGASPNHLNDDGVSPLIMAAAAGDLKTLTVFLEDGQCDALLHSPDGTTALFASAANGHKEAAVALLKFEPKAYWKFGCDGLLPVQVAAYNSHIQLVDALNEALSESKSTPPSGNDAVVPEDESKFGFFPADDQKAIDALYNTVELVEKFSTKRKEDVVSTKKQILESLQNAKSLKEAGNKAFIGKNLEEAIKLYSDGVEECERAAVAKGKLTRIHEGEDDETAGFEVDVFAPLLCNRCSCFTQTKNLDEAIADAKRATEVAPKWPKAMFRLGQCYTAKEMHAEAAQAFWDGYQMAPKDKAAPTLLKLFKVAVEKGKAQHKNKAKSTDDAKAAIQSAEPPSTEKYDRRVPVEVPDRMRPGKYVTLLLGFNKSDAPAEAAGRFVRENKLDESLIPRIAQHIHSIMEEE